jgi:octanoyl-[GcvH]:protein N-octanoyltransferase
MCDNGHTRNKPLIPGARQNEHVDLVRDWFPDRPAFGAAVSRAILERVAACELAPTIRLHRTGRVLAFGRQDAASDRFQAAVAAARGAGFEPIVRLAGGRAALYHEGTIALSWATPDPNATSGAHSRFEQLSELLAGAVRRLGVDARVGEVPGEYCPGAYSVNARGRSKLVGIGQRIVSGGAHLGVVVVVRDSTLVREALIPVYDALGLDWDPATAGSVEDELGDTDLAAVEDALLEALADAGHELHDATLDPETLALAERREADHRPAA